MGASDDGVGRTGPRGHAEHDAGGRHPAGTADVADALAGRWTGTPRVPPVDYSIFLEFTKHTDGTVQGQLVGTDLKTFRAKMPPTIDKPLRDFTVNGRRLDFELPNTQPWTFSGELAADGSAITGFLNSGQGGLPVTFKKH